MRNRGTPPVGQSIWRAIPRSSSKPSGTWKLGTKRGTKGARTEARHDGPREVRVSEISIHKCRIGAGFMAPIHTGNKGGRKDASGTLSSGLDR